MKPLLVFCYSILLPGINIYPDVLINLYIRTRWFYCFDYYDTGSALAVMVGAAIFFVEVSVEDSA